MDRRKVRNLRKPVVFDNTEVREPREFVSATTGEVLSTGSETGSVDDETGNVAAEPGNPGNAGINESATGSVATENRFVDPTTAGAGPKKRGRKAGGKNAPKAIAFATTNLEKVLFNLHTMGAAILAEPELVIDEDEAKLLADAVAGVARAYDWSAVMSQKSQATLDMCIALGTVYGARLITIARRPKKRAPHVVTMQPAQPVQTANGNIPTPTGNVQ